MSVAVCCSVLRCVALCCSVLQCIAVCCSAQDRNSVRHRHFAACLQQPKFHIHWRSPYSVSVAQGESVKTKHVGFLERCLGDLCDPCKVKETFGTQEFIHSEGQNDGTKPLPMVCWCCSVMLCVTACCNVLQCVAVCCSVLHRVAVNVVMCCRMLPRVAACCRVLPRVAACCSMV